MLDPDMHVLRFEEVKARVLGALQQAGLRPYAIGARLDLDDLSRTLKFCVVPEGWTEPFKHRAQVEFTHDVTHAAAASDPEGRPDDPEDFVYHLEVQVEFHMVGPGDGLAMDDLKPYAKPRLDRLNATLGRDRPLQIYYTVSTDYAGKDHPVSAEVPYLVVLCLVEEEFDLTELVDVLKIGLEALGPPAPETPASDSPRKRW